MSRVLSLFSTPGKRTIQEDALWGDVEKGLFLVVDGFGGPTAGVHVSKQVCEEVKRFLIREVGDDEATLPYVLRSYYSLAANVLFNSLIFANQKIFKYNKDKGIHEKGGASALVAYLDENLLSIANVGSGSAHLFRNGKRAEIATPRSLRRLQDPFHQMSEDVPLMSLGTSYDLEPEIFEYRIQPGDALLLLTDGFGFSQREELLATLEKAPLTEREFESRLEGYSFEDNASALYVVF